MLTHPALILPKQLAEFPPFVRYDALFSPPECDELERIGNSHGLVPGSIGNWIANQPVVNPAYRSVLSTRLEVSEVPWAYERLRDRAQWTNDAYFGFDLHGLQQGLVYLRYETGEFPGQYGWHQDFGGGESSLRKLSIVTQLSDPERYEGCRLKLFTDREFDAPTVGRGDTIIFPSWTPHCVTPVTRGVRSALVAWVSGPRFR